MFGHMDVLKQMLNSEKETIKNNVGKIVNRLLSFALIKESLEEWKDTILELFLYQSVWKVVLKWQIFEKNPVPIN